MTSRLLIPLRIGDLPLGKPLTFSVYSQTGVLLTPRGYELASIGARERLLNAGPFRDVNETDPAEAAEAGEAGGSDAAAGGGPGERAGGVARPPGAGPVDVLPDVAHNVEHLQLIVQLAGEADKRTLGASFHGKIGVQALIVSAPALDTPRGWAGCVNQPITVRLTSARKVYQFLTTVLSAHTAPTPHLYLRYPASTRQGVFRRAVRLATQLPAVVRTGDGREIAGTIVDMSGAGCAFDTTAAVGEVGESFTLAFQTGLAEDGAMLVVPVVLRNLPKQHAAGPVTHGLSFGDGKGALDSWLRLTLKAFICENLLEGEQVAA